MWTTIEYSELKPGDRARATFEGEVDDHEALYCPGDVRLKAWLPHATLIQRFTPDPAPAPREIVVGDEVRYAGSRHNRFKVIAIDGGMAWTKSIEGTPLRLSVSIFSLSLAKPPVSKRLLVCRKLAAEFQTYAASDYLSGERDEDSLMEVLLAAYDAGQEDAP